MTTKNIGILIIEDNRNFTESLRDLIETSEFMEFRANFSSAEAYLEAASSGTLPQADIVLLDLYLPGRDGLSLMPIIKKDLPESRVIVLTQNDDYQSALNAIHLGVSGYLIKSSRVDDIRRTIREVADGGCIIDSQLSRHVLEALKGDQLREGSPLTKREIEVIELMAMGYVKKEVAEQLNLSPRTVAYYTENIYQKLQVPNITAAVAAAIRKKLI